MSINTLHKGDDDDDDNNNNNTEPPGLIQDWEMYPITNKFKKIRKRICTMACRKYRGKCQRGLLCKLIYKRAKTFITK